MLRRLNDLPVYSTCETDVPAHFFNHIKLTNLRIPGALRFSLKPLKHIDAIIDHDSWVCVDTNMNDLPIVAWLDFQAKARNNLHEPVHCRRNYYHFMASSIASNALELVDAYLMCQLDEWAQQGVRVTKPRSRKIERGHLSLVD